MKEQGAPSPWLTAHTLTGNASCSEQMGQRQHQHTDTEELQGVPQLPQHGCDPPADPQTPPHPKGIPYGAAASIPGSAHSQILPHPSEAGKHHPLPQQESSIRAAGTAPWSRRLKQPGAPAHTLNWGPLSPDTKCCA